MEQSKIHGYPLGKIYNYEGALYFIIGMVYPHEKYGTKIYEWRKILQE